MKKLLILFIVAFLFCCADAVCLAADYSTIQESINRALQLRETQDIDGAIKTLQKALTSADVIDAEEKGDNYTKEYLQTLIACLRADEVTYSGIINYTASVVKKTSDLFFEIVDELKSGEISAASSSKIKEMKQEMSRAMVTHSFCVPPQGYKEIYNLTQEALFRYSKAWGNLYLIAFEDPEEKDKLQTEALLNFQKGNELFSQAGSLMLAIPNK